MIIEDIVWQLRIRLVWKLDMNNDVVQFRPYYIMWFPNI